MDKDESDALWDRLATMPHYHVISRHQGGDSGLVYTDGHTHEGALSHAADLVELSSENENGAVAAVWIVEAPSVGCPLAHGEDDPEEGEAVESEYLRVAMAQTPFWMAAQPDEPATEALPVSIVKLEESGDDEYALELGDCMVIIKFAPPSGMDVQFPPGQLEKWQRIAYREDKTVDEVVKAAIAAAFSRLGDEAQ